MSAFDAAAEFEASSPLPDLAAAARSGDVAAVERAIAAGLAIDQRFESGITMLMLGADNGNWEVCMKLAEFGADLNLTDRWSRTALMWAAEKGQLEVCLKLTELGADLNKTDRVSETCCNRMSVCCCLNVTLIYFLNEFRSTALMWAAEEGQLEVYLKLAELGADLNKADQWSRTALVLAAEKGQWEVCVTLAKLRADRNKTDRDGRTALVVAADHLRWEVFVKLAELGTEINKADGGGRTAFMLTAENGQIEVCVKLAELGADLNKADQEGDTALHLACRGKELEVAKWLVEQMSREAALALNQLISQQIEQRHNERQKILLAVNQKLRYCSVYSVI